MAGLRTTAYALAASLLVAATACAATTSYHIGNSLTWDSQPLSLSEFAAMRGREHDAAYHILSGAPLNEIISLSDSPSVSFADDYGRFDSALVDHAWSAVTMQPYSGSGATIGSELDAILDVIDLTRSNPANAETRFYLYAGWPARSSSYQTQWNQPVEDSLATPAMRARAYYDHLINRVRAARDVEVYLIPVGEVLSELDLQIQQGLVPGYSTIQQFYRDNLHMNTGVGRYLAAATTFAALLGEEPRGLTPPDGRFTFPPPNDPGVFEIINETIRRTLNQNAYSGVEFLDPPLADFDGSGVVDGVDLAIWQGAAGKSAVADANGDSIVDGTDFLAWQRRVGFDVRRTEDFEQEDKNTDGLVDGGDLTIWREAFAVSTAYDLDNDGDTDGADFLSWQRALTQPAAEDFDRDGIVNAGDVVLWQDNFGFNLAADANGDGLVDDADYLIWVKEEGRVWPLPDAASAVTAVPEPAGWAMAAGAVLVALAGRRSARKSS